MTHKRQKGRTAAELLSELEADPSYVSRRDEQEGERQRREAELRVLSVVHLARA